MSSYLSVNQSKKRTCCLAAQSQQGLISYCASQFVTSSGCADDHGGLITLTRESQLAECWYRRTHQSLASVGVAASVRLINTAGEKMSPAVWTEALQMLSQAARETFPDVGHLVSAAVPAPATPNTPQPASPQKGLPKPNSTPKLKMVCLPHRLAAGLHAMWVYVYQKGVCNFRST